MPGSHFISPWMFDYPDIVYCELCKAIGNISNIEIPILRLIEEAKIKGNLIPIFLAAKIDLEKYWDKSSLEIWEWEFYKELLKQTRKGLSLPYIFYTILQHFLKVITDSTVNIQKYNPEDYAKFLFINENTKHNPLGIYDPLKTIDNLINSLCILRKAKNDDISKFKQFRLIKFNILQGKRSINEGWKTLLAYCGGRLKDNSRCDKNPLVLGEASLCKKCGRLICPECNYCLDNCEEYKLRQKNINQPSEGLNSLSKWQVI
jgi:hypothetical protein